VVKRGRSYVEKLLRCLALALFHRWRLPENLTLLRDVKLPTALAALLAAVIVGGDLPAFAAEQPELFVAVGYGGRRMSSTDGVTWQHEQRWSDEAQDDDNVLFNIAYGLNRFIAVGGGASIGHLVATRDGKYWKELPQVKGRVATIAFGNGRFVAGHDAELLYSADGEHFRAGAKFEVKGSLHARRSTFGSGEGGPRFVIIGDVDLHETRTRVYWRGSTEDGTQVTSLDVDTPPARDIAYGSGHFVVVGPQGLIESSHDGQTWRRHETRADHDFSRVVWTGERFLVSGGETVWSSPDALTWSAETVRSMQVSPSLRTHQSLSA
jgi:hypothetical protein